MREPRIAYHGNWNSGLNPARIHAPNTFAARVRPTAIDVTSKITGHHVRRMQEREKKHCAIGACTDVSISTRYLCNM
ncbi:hypothetical protein M404DRAFT_1001132 [Pisolithus tinctorius Marx 270]|uniref:Uncharacterized protein n=1 Tax=Pisolithus tinctorius Marx 270 TaxID=870435 RepID=A0A0C3P841_PISTI|nr:hypothetical protein M404DRAFT_1001132 [Pisolithus tinctorius Marx 270]